MKTYRVYSIEICLRQVPKARWADFKSGKSRLLSCIKTGLYILNVKKIIILPQILLKGVNGRYKVQPNIIFKMLL